MPLRNIVKEYSSNSYYHVYNSGANKQIIFKTDQDYEVFKSLLKRYLGPKTEKKGNRLNHPNYFYEIELLAYCLLNNQFHLFIYQEPSNSITKFMRSLTTAYSMYYNKKYNRSGPLFQHRYRAVRMQDDSHLLPMSGYIHTIPKEYNNYQWSSYNNYIKNIYPEGEWLRPLKITSLVSDYASYVSDYLKNKSSLGEIKQYRIDYK